jgi:hypothetical protein
MTGRFYCISFTKSNRRQDLKRSSGKIHATGSIHSEKQPAFATIFGSAEKVADQVQHWYEQ